MCLSFDGTTVKHGQSIVMHSLELKFWSITSPCKASYRRTLLSIFSGTYKPLVPRGNVSRDRMHICLNQSLDSYRFPSCPSLVWRLEQIITPFALGPESGPHVVESEKALP